MVRDTNRVALDVQIEEDEEKNREEVMRRPHTVTWIDGKSSGARRLLHPPSVPEDRKGASHVWYDVDDGDGSSRPKASGVVLRTRVARVGTIEVEVAVLVAVAREVVG